MLEAVKDTNKNSLCASLCVQIYLSVLWQGGRLGLAYYDLATTQIHMMPDTLEAEDFSLLRRGMVKFPPICIVMTYWEYKQEHGPMSVL